MVDNLTLDEFIALVEIKGDEVVDVDCTTTPWPQGVVVQRKWIVIHEIGAWLLYLIACFHCLIKVGCGNSHALYQDV